MPITFPEFSDIVARSRADVQAILPGVDPTLENSLLDAITVAISSRVADAYADMARAIRERFPQTATGSSLDDLGAVFGVARLQASKASGSVNVPGTAGVTIPSGTEFSNATGALYTATASASINSVTLSVTSLTRSGQTVTATFATAHGFATGQSVIIAGADQSAYNGSFTVTALSQTEIQYTVSGSPASPAPATAQADLFGGAGGAEAIAVRLETLAERAEANAAALEAAATNA